MPGLAAASVCTSVAPRLSRTPLTMPRVTLFCSMPSADPIAITSWPGRSVRPSPSAGPAATATPAPPSAPRCRRPASASRPAPHARPVHLPQRHVAVLLHDVHVGQQRVLPDEEPAAASARGFDPHHRRHHAVDHVFESRGRCRVRQRAPAGLAREVRSAPSVSLPCARRHPTRGAPPRPRAEASTAAAGSPGCAAARRLAEAAAAGSRRGSDDEASNSRRRRRPPSGSQSSDRRRTRRLAVRRRPRLRAARRRTGSSRPRRARGGRTTDKAGRRQS